MPLRARDGRAGPRLRVWLVPLSLGLGMLAMWIVLRRAGVTPGMVFTRVAGRAHVAALLAVSLEIAARAARVWFVARGLGLPLRYRDSVQAQLAGDAWAALTPSRVGSDPAKILVLHRRGVDVGQAGTLLLAEMAAEATLLSAAALALALALPERGWWVALGLAGYTFTVLAAGGITLTVARWPGSRPPVFWGALGLSGARWGALASAAQQFRNGVRALGRLPRHVIAGALGAGALHIAARLAVLPVLVLLSPPADSVAAPSWVELVLRPFFVLYATALLPPPGGGGGVELAFASVLSAALPGVALATNLVWWRWYTFYLSALLGWLFLGVSHARAYKMSVTGPSQDLSPSFSGTLDGR